MQDVLAARLREDQSLWEKMEIPTIGTGLLIEESYYEGLILDLKGTIFETRLEEDKPRWEKQHSEDGAFLLVEKRYYQEMIHVLDPKSWDLRR